MADHRDSRWLVETVVDRQIREATERGDFADLPGTGRPIQSVRKDYDPDWWAKSWVRRQRLETELADLRHERRRIAPRSAVDASAADRLQVIDARLTEIEQDLSAT